jgi:5-methylthioadenosine/S-adenosylhomocysteine deaminase
MTKTLIRSGAVVTVDPNLGMLPRGDVLVEETRILAIGEDLAGHPSAKDATVLDAQDMIVIPGLVNAHIHLWQTALRGIGGNWAGSDYYNYVHANLAPRFTPDDTLASTYMGALNQLDGGTTTVFDWCHNNTTPDHSDAAIDGLARSGIRAVFGHGTVKPKPKPGDPHFSQIPHPRAEIERLRRERFAANDGLLTLAMCILGPDYSTLDVCRKDFALARELDLLSSAHVWGRSNRLVPEGYRTIAAEGLLGPKHNLTHANYIADDEIKVIVDAGASITATAPAELKGHARPPLIGRVAAQGGRPSIANDSELGVTGEMFQTIRLSLQAQRLFNNQDLQRRLEEGDPDLTAYAKKNLAVIGTGGGLVEEISIPTMEALRWATINNAWALGLEDRIGSLTPGKQADIVLIRRTDLNLAPALNPVDAVVMFAQAHNVDTVFVAGRKMKENGRLLLCAKALTDATADLARRGRHLLAEAGLSNLAA